MVQRTGSQKEGNMLFIQNNFYYDAFFLKAIGRRLSLSWPRDYLANTMKTVLNGACGSGFCTYPNGSGKYHVSALRFLVLHRTHMNGTKPFGVSYSGATYKYTVIDTNGRRSAAAGSALRYFLLGHSLTVDS